MKKLIRTHKVASGSILGFACIAIVAFVFLLPKTHQDVAIVSGTSFSGWSEQLGAGEVFAACASTVSNPTSDICNDYVINGCINGGFLGTSGTQNGSFWWYCGRNNYSGEGYLLDPTNMECTYTPPPTPVAGVCGTTTNGCTTGTLGANAVQSDGSYQWYCNGTDGGATSPLCVYKTPTPAGTIDGVTSGISCGLVNGWAYDSDKSSQSIDVHVYVDGPAGSGTGYNTGATTVARPDVNAAFGITGVHGFSYQLPTLSLGTHTAYAYGIGINSSGAQDGGNFPALSNSPMTFTCSTSATPDLTASSVSPSSAAIGIATSFSATISNIGNASTGTGFTNLFQRATDTSGTGATDIGTSAAATLAPGGTASASLSYTFTSVGTFYLRACADKSSAGNTGVITESNENNNCGAWTAITAATSCSASLGNACTSVANNCGQTNAGTVGCDGSCSAATPSNTNCPGAEVSCTDATASNYGGSLPCTYALRGCPVPYGSPINSGQSVSRFRDATVISPAVCQVENRLCTNGVLGGSYENLTCRVLVPSIDSFTASPTRVRLGGTTVVSWSTTDVTSCRVTRNGASWPSGSGTSSSGTQDTVLSQTIYTITCDALPSQSVTVNVVPVYQEF